MLGGCLVHCLFQLYTYEAYPASAALSLPFLKRRYQSSRKHAIALTFPNQLLLYECCENTDGCEPSPLARVSSCITAICGKAARQSSTLYRLTRPPKWRLFSLYPQPYVQVLTAVPGIVLWGQVTSPSLKYFPLNSPRTRICPTLR